MDKSACGYELKLTSIGSGSWQLFICKVDESSDYVRVIYGITEQVGGSTRKFKTLRNYILTPETGSDPVFMYQFEEHAMKNRRAWVAFETVQRVKGKRGDGISTYLALSPVQSKWRARIGSTTDLEVRPLGKTHFKQLGAADKSLDSRLHELIETGIN